MAINPGNVSQLKTFFEANSPVPLEQLKQSSLQTGYSSEDVEEAIKLLPQANVSKVNQQPSATGQPATANKTIGKTAKIILVVLVVLALCGTGVAAFFLIRNNANTATSENSVTTKDRIASLPTASPSASAKVTAGATQSAVPTANPLSGYKQLLTNSQFKILTTGKLSSDDNSASVAATTTLNLDGAVFYLKKGTLLRADLEESGGKLSLMLLNNNLFFLDHTGKTYTQLNTTGKPATESLLYPLFHYSLPVIGLLEAQDQGKLTWQKNSDTEWQTEWVYPLLAQGSSKPFAIKVVLNSTGKVLNTFSLKKDAASPWQDIGLNYVQVGTLDQDIVIPADYKIASLSAMIAGTTPTSSPSVTPTPKK